MRPDFELLTRSWLRSLRARNLSPATVELYGSTAGQLAAFAAERDVDPLERETIEEYLADLSARRKPATVSARFRALQQFTRWLSEED